MQIVIDIPENLYKAAINGLNAEEIWDLRVAIKNGTPLPKGHGRLIDADILEECKEVMNTIMNECEYVVRMDEVRNVPTIIEAYTKKTDTAINALKQEPCTDAISRQAVLSMQYRINDSATLSMRDVVNVDDIEELPPVNPSEKVGHWIYDKLRYWDGGYKYECSECGMGSDVNYAYCMCCGCKMQEVEDD